jgi:serine/threonine protein phosphatase PrpC
MYAKIANISNNICGLFCVADGMGGLADGQYAATVAADAAGEWWDTRLQALIDSGDIANESILHGELSRIFAYANTTILQQDRRQFCWARQAKLL